MENTVQIYLGSPGTMISGSKSGYMKNNPDNLVVFNANIVILYKKLLCKKVKKIWFGDIDITLSIENLKELSKELDNEILVLREMDGRFENEEKPLIENYVLKISPTGSISLGSLFEKYYSIETLKRV